MADTPLQRAQRRGNAMDQERRSTWDAHFRELAEYQLPWKSRFLASEINKGNKRGTKILDGIARKSARTLSSGMMAGMTSPGRPWFDLEPFDPDQLEFNPIKEHLESVVMRANMVLSRSNFYQTMPNLYTELGVFGTGAFLIEEDYEDVINTTPFTIGEYAIAQDHRKRVNSFYRTFEYTIEEAMGHFYNKALPNSRQRLSRYILDEYDRGNYDKPVKFFHLIEQHDPDSPIDLGMTKGRPFHGLYWEERAIEKKSAEMQAFAQARGYWEFPVMAPRWDTTSGDIYGNGPGQDALADVKQLQVMQKRKLNRLELLNKPPMGAPASMRNERSSILPGDITYQPDNSQRKFEPLYQVHHDLRDLREEIAETRKSVEEYYYVDLFRALINSDKNGLTAREVSEIHEEKLLGLGPVLERLSGEGYDPALNRVLGIMKRAGIMPEAPKEMRDQPLRIKYVSILAQAQRMADTAAIVDLGGFVTTLAPAFPDVLDRFDVDAAVDKYQEFRGAPVSVIRPLAKAQEIRQERAKAQQAQQQQALGAQAIDSAKTLSETNTTGSNALSAMLGM